MYKSIPYYSVLISYIQSTRKVNIRPRARVCTYLSTLLGISLIYLGSGERKARKHGEISLPLNNPQEEEGRRVSASRRGSRRWILEVSAAAGMCIHVDVWGSDLDFRFNKNR
ncbi:hypothetical protein TSAR_012931 [Trichomalopsis sarcophagae]|uniref:Uncharacterized protein n=1 Tax=Trichomalopsis sarcophagae TaxID=543379 RepID=A0A232EXN1_9HYME|nr:hypothetical protein TSAR_012931 [Trichomalopsis sarcophagae]